MGSKQGGNGGKWQTSHQKTKIDGRVAIELGDVGVWVTCARNQEAKAAREVEQLFDEVRYSPAFLHDARCCKAIRGPLESLRGKRPLSADC